LLDGRPSLLDIISAKRRIDPYITRTPLHHYLSLDNLLDAEIYVKHENHLRLGAFKMRGGINLIAQLTKEEKKRGVISASTGNHGQSIAYAATLFGVKSIIGVPENANPYKVESIRNLGGKVIFHGRDFDEARQHVELLSREEGYRYIHSANEPMLLAGVATATLEIFEDLPDLDIIIVPVGGGSSASASAIVAHNLKPDVKIIGVQAEQAKGAYLSWKSGSISESTMNTKAEGLATRVGFELTMNIMRDLLYDFVLVSEKEIEEAIVMSLEKTHNLTEHAGAASLAAAIKLKDVIKNKKVVLMNSGGNITATQLNSVLTGNTGSL